MKVVILAGGKGTRLRPITESVPKPLVEISGKPFISFVLDELEKTSITQICIIGSYKIEILREYLNQHYPKITLVNQGEPLGTGHALLAAEEFCKNDEFIVLGADNLFPAKDINSLIDTNLGIGAIEVKDWERYGILQVEKKSLVSIIEKPKTFVGNLANGGIYKLDNHIWPLLKKLQKSPRGEYELTDAITQLAKTQSMTVHQLSDWTDLGSIKDIKNITKKFNSK